MGNTSSQEVQNIVTNKTVNQTTLNSLNKTVVSTTYSVTNKSSSTCSSGSVSGLQLTINDLTVKGNLNLNINQTTSALLDFSCTQTSTFQSDLSSSISQSINEQITSTLQSASQTLLQNALANMQTTDLGSIFDGLNSASQSTKDKVTNITKNTQDITLQDIVDVSTQVTLDNIDVKSAIANSFQTQKAALSGITVQGDAVLNLTQKMVNDVVVDVIQNTDMSSQVTSNLATALGLAVKNNTAVDNGTSAITDEKSTQTAKGIGDLISSIFDSISEYMALIGAAGISSSLCLCLICILLIFALFFLG